MERSLAITSLSSAADESAVIVSADGLTAYVASNRDRDAGYFVYVAHRDTAAVDFPTPAIVAELAATDAGAMHPGWLSADGCRLYLSMRSGTTGDLFVATRVDAPP